MEITPRNHSRREFAYQHTLLKMQVAPNLLVEPKVENLVLLERSGMPQEPLTGTDLPEPMHTAWLTSRGTAVQLRYCAKHKASSVLVRLRQLAQRQLDKRASLPIPRPRTWINSAPAASDGDKKLEMFGKRSKRCDQCSSAQSKFTLSSTRTWRHEFACNGGMARSYIVERSTLTIHNLLCSIHGHHWYR